MSFERIKQIQAKSLPNASRAAKAHDEQEAERTKVRQIKEAELTNLQSKIDDAQSRLSSLKAAKEAARKRTEVCRNDSEREASRADMSRLYDNCHNLSIVTCVHAPRQARVELHAEDSPEPEDLSPRYRAISGAKLRDGFEMHSADAGSLDPGQVVDALEGMFLNSKTYYE
jgi:hypothetical protein